MPHANPSGRSLNKVNLSFNLINIPTTLYTGTVSDHGITRKQFASTDDGEVAVGRGLTNKETGELLTPEEVASVVKKIDTEYGSVYLEDSEIEQLFTLQPDTLEVKEFEPQTNFHQGHFVPSGLLYVEPRKGDSGKAKGKPDPLATRLMATLFQAMRKHNAMAVCELTTRGKPKPCILMPDGRLWLVQHTDAVREQREFPETEVVDAEVTMMGTLIETMWQDQPLDFTDVRTELIQAKADEKARAGDFDKPEDDGTTVVAPAATTDLMAMLSASVAAAKAEREAV